MAACFALRSLQTCGLGLRFISGTQYIEMCGRKSLLCACHCLSVRFMCGVSVCAIGGISVRFEEASEPAEQICVELYPSNSFF